MSRGSGTSIRIIEPRGWFTQHFDSKLDMVALYAWMALAFKLDFAEDAGYKRS
jgi:hypothetical protein